MLKIIRAAAIATTFVAISAQAQVYVEGNYVPTKITVGGESVKPHIFSGIIGYDLHPNLSVEGMIGLGAKKATIDGTDVKYKSAYGVYLKPRYQVSQDVEVFARIGYIKSKLELSDSTGTESDSSSSAAWGVGGSYAIDKNLYLTAGYNQLYKKDGWKVTGFNFGVGYKF